MTQCRNHRPLIVGELPARGEIRPDTEVPTQADTTGYLDGFLPRRAPTPVLTIGQTRLAIVCSHPAQLRATQWLSDTRWATLSFLRMAAKNATPHRQSRVLSGLARPRAKCLSAPMRVGQSINCHGLPGASPRCIFPGPLGVPRSQGSQGRPTSTPTRTRLLWAFRCMLRHGHRHRHRHRPSHSRRRTA